MALKRLFDGQDHQTSKGLDLLEEVANALKPILDKFYAEGYSLRDMNLIMSLGIHEAVMTKLMETKDERKKSYAIKIALRPANGVPDAATNQPGPEFEMSHDLLEVLRSPAHTGPDKKVSAIKALRIGSYRKDAEGKDIANTALGLKEAKDCIEILSYYGFIDAGAGYPHMDANIIARIIDVVKCEPIQNKYNRTHEWDAVTY